PYPSQAPLSLTSTPPPLHDALPIFQQVEPATKPLPTCKTHEALNRLLDRKIEACCDYTSDCIQKVTFHPLLAAAHFAFSQHRPLDRKSTRLNSSHQIISYAVFCLKK